MQDFKSKYGPWALVTGASSGIGQEFARQLASKGLNVVLAARRKDRLDKNAKDLESKYGVKTKTVEVDLTDPGFSKTLDDATSDLEIGMLVNNAGAEVHGNFLESDPDKDTWLIDLNVIAPIKLARLYGKKMAQRGRGGIIFVASVVAYQGVPYFANYSGTKAYILTFAESLNYELKQKGVDVTVLSPGFTDTEMPAQMLETGMDFSSVPLKMMSVTPVVEAALGALGKTSSVIPGTMNQFMTFLGTRLLSRKRAVKMFGDMMGKTMTKGK